MGKPSARRIAAWLAVLQVGLLTASLIGPAVGPFKLPVAEVQAAPAGTALTLNGSSQYATVGTTSTLRSSSFTLELWFKRAAGGVTQNTGSGGVTAYPLITKGRAEAETAAADVNYFFGIDATGHLAADFEEAQVAAGGTTPGLNHPITGSGTVPASDTGWHHAAATYDGTTWRLYLDGNLDGTLAVSRAANVATAVVTAIGSSWGTAGNNPLGFFSGTIDEARIWNIARSQAQIQASKNPRDHRADHQPDRRLEPERGHRLQPRRQLTATRSSARPSPRRRGSPGLMSLVTVPSPSTARSQYATVGTTSTLRSSSFTLELWFKRAAGGVTQNTGSGGVTAYPLITKGRAEAETAAADVNYFFGIDATGHLAADFEEAQVAAGGRPRPQPSDHRHRHGEPATPAGTTPRRRRTARRGGCTSMATSTGRSRRPGSPRREPGHDRPSGGPDVGRRQRSAGFFAGTIDEARIWNTARSRRRSRPPRTSRSLRRPGWSALEPQRGQRQQRAQQRRGRAIGTIIGGPAWIDGFARRAPPPAPPVRRRRPNAATDVARPPTLDVIASDADGGDLDVAFFGRPLASGTSQLIGTHDRVASGAHATLSWAGLGGGQTYQWYRQPPTDGPRDDRPDLDLPHQPPRRRPVVIGVGDIASCTSTGDEADRRRRRPDRRADLHDRRQRLPDRDARRVHQLLSSPAGAPFKARTRPVPGNHDWGNTAPGQPCLLHRLLRRERHGRRWQELLQLRHRTRTGTSSTSTPSAANVARRLRRRLAPARLARRRPRRERRSKNVIAVWHKPRFSSGLDQPGGDAGTSSTSCTRRASTSRSSATTTSTSGSSRWTRGRRATTRPSASRTSRSGQAEPSTMPPAPRCRRARRRRTTRPTASCGSSSTRPATTGSSCPSPARRSLTRAREPSTSAARSRRERPRPRLPAAPTSRSATPPSSTSRQFTHRDLVQADRHRASPDSTGTGGLDASSRSSPTVGPRPTARTSMPTGSWASNDATDVLAADFEDARRGEPSGLGHDRDRQRCRGTTPPRRMTERPGACIWMASSRRRQVENATPRADTTQHAGLGVMLMSNGIPRILLGSRATSMRPGCGARRTDLSADPLDGQRPDRGAGSGPTGALGHGRRAPSTVEDSIAPTATGSIIGTGSTRRRRRAVRYLVRHDATGGARPASARQAGDGTVELPWTAKVEPDLAGYNVYRSTTTPVASGRR